MIANASEENGSGRTTTTTTAAVADQTTREVTTTDAVATTAAASTTDAEAVTSAAPTDPQEAVAFYVREILGEKVVSVDTIPQANGGLGVAVVTNISDLLFMGLTAGGFESDAGEIMTSLFHEHPELGVRWVAIEGQFPLQDEFGNVEQGTVAAVRLEEEIADQVNWATDSSTLELQILPGLYDWTFIHPELAEHLP